MLRSVPGFSSPMRVGDDLASRTRYLSLNSRRFPEEFLAPHGTEITRQDISRCAHEMVPRGVDLSFAHANRGPIHDRGVASRLMPREAKPSEVKRSIRKPQEAERLRTRKGALDRI